MTDEKASKESRDGTPITRRTALKSLSGTALGALAFQSAVGVGSASIESNSPSWDDTGTYDTQFPEGTTHIVCSSLELVDTFHVPSEPGLGVEEHWVYTFEAASQVSAVETSTGDPLGKLRSQGIRIKNNNTNEMTIAPSVASDSDALAPDPDNPDVPGGIPGAVLGVVSLATALAQRTPLALFIGGADLSTALGVVAYEVTTPSNYKEYVWDGGYDGIEKGAHQVTFEALSYYKSPADNPAVQISTHASQAYAGWDLEFDKDDVSVSDQEQPGRTRGPMGNPEEMSDEEKEEFGIKKVPRSEITHQDGELQSESLPEEEVYIAEDPPISVTSMDTEVSKELWERSNQDK